MSAGFYCRSLMVIVAIYLPPVFAEGLLHHDPFARPQLGVHVPGSMETAGAVSESGAPWNPQLTAVMLDGKNSLVSLDGEIVRMGEKKDGYRLIQVREHEAEFKKDGKHVVLKMDTSSSVNSNERGSK